jgi:hypothetical protein
MKITSKEFKEDPVRYIRVAMQGDIVEIYGDDGKRRSTISAPQPKFPEEWYPIAGDWLRAIEKTRDELLPLEGLKDDAFYAMDARHDEFNAITRRYVRGLLDQGASLERLAELADFPCPACTSGAYNKGPHKFGCSLRGARQMIVSATYDEKTGKYKGEGHGNRR